MRSVHLLLLSSIFLVVAIVAGTVAMALTGSAGQERAARETTSAAFEELRGVLADILFLQLDQYHHIWIYQGNPWHTATDYLPQIWLIARLDPQFIEVYVDGAYHLAVNLGRPDEGMELLREGMAANPDNEDLMWEYAFLIQQLEESSPEARLEACWDLLHLARRRSGTDDPLREKNVCDLLEIIFRDEAVRRGAERISSRYQRRQRMLFWLESGIDVTAMGEG
jgi:hypothetical protein